MHTYAFEVILLLLLCTTETAPGAENEADASSTESTATLIESLKHPLPSVRYQAVKAIGKAPDVTPATIAQISRLLKHEQPGVRQHAFFALEELGAKARPAVPMLLSIIGNKKADPDDRYLACTSLTSIGPDVADTLPVLVDALDDTCGGVRGGAVDALGDMGAAAKPAVPALLRIAATDRGASAIVTVGRKARRALARIGAPAVPSLVNALGHCDVRYRRAAAAALNSMTESAPAAAREAIAPLLKALEDPDDVVRAHAAIATWNATRDVARTVPVLDALVRKARPSWTDEGWDVRGLAIRGLGHVGPDAERAIPVLIDVIRDESTYDYHRNDAVVALGQIGPAAKAALPHIFQQRFSLYRAFRENAAVATRRIDPEARVPIAVVVHQIQHHPVYVHIAIVVLQELDADSRRAFESMVVPLLKCSDSAVRLAAVKSLEAIGPGTEVSIDALQDLQRDDDKVVIRFAAEQALRATRREACGPSK